MKAAFLVTFVGAVIWTTGLEVSWAQPNLSLDGLSCAPYRELGEACHAQLKRDRGVENPKAWQTQEAWRQSFSDCNEPSIMHQVCQGRRVVSKHLQAELSHRIKQGLIYNARFRLADQLAVAKGMGVSDPLPNDKKAKVLQTCQTEPISYKGPVSEMLSKAQKIAGGKTQMGTPDEIDNYTRRFLIAYFEAHRLRQILSKETDVEKELLIRQRLNKIFQFYPGVGLLRGDKLLGLKHGDVFENHLLSNEISSEALNVETETVDQWIFPQTFGLAPLDGKAPRNFSPKGSGKSADYYASLYSWLADSRKKISSSVTGNIRDLSKKAIEISLNEVAAICQRQDCENIAYNMSLTSRLISHPSTKERELAIQSVCDCQIAKPERLISEGLVESGLIAGGAVTVGCVVFAAVCAPAVVVGAGVGMTGLVGLEWLQSVRDVSETQRRAEQSLASEQLNAGSLADETLATWNESRQNFYFKSAELVTTAAGSGVGGRALASVVDVERRTAVAWKEYAEGFQSAAKSNIEYHSKHYRRAKDLGDRQVKFLERLGFKFGDEISVPPLKEIHHRLNKQTDQWVKEGLINKDEALYPARTFMDPKTGQVIGLRWGEEIPKGYKPYGDILSNEDFIRLISEGKFPIGDVAYTAPGRLSMSLHDLGHFGAFADDPQFMAAFRKSMKDILESPQGSFVNETHKMRVFLAAETMSIVSTESRSKVTHLLKNITGASHKSLAPRTFDEYRQMVAEFSPEKQEQIRMQLVREYWPMIGDYGGTARDIISREVYAPENLAQFAQKQNLRGFGYEILFAQEGQQGVDNIARLLTSMDHLRDMNPSEYIRAAAAAKVDRNSKLYRYTCLSGIWVKGSEVYDLHCQ